jgi:hypothetical protein
MKSLDPRAGENSGVALVVTLIILVLLATLAVALLQTSSLEQGTSKAVADKAKGDLIARTAVNAAIAQLIDKLTRYPDSATTWETINGNDGTMLYYRDETPEQAIASGVPAQMYVFPLISGGTAQTFANRNNSLPVLTDSGPTANAYNFNHTRFSGDTQGWIGTAPGAATAPQPLRGEWINLTDSDSKVTGRYAYWMEDESFKANANYMGNTARGSNTLGDNPNQIPFQGILKAVLTGSPDYDTIAGEITSYRSQFPGSFFFNFRDINQVNGQATLADNAKFEATLFSGAMNLSRSGTKRVDLNRVVADSTDPTAIRNQLDQIISSITFHLPNFGQRFYRLGSDLNSLDVPNTTDTPHQTIYLNKIAANIRDYIDTDSQPTIVQNDPPTYSIIIGSPPTHSIPGGGASGANEVVAIGKENVPFLQEYLLRVKEVIFSAKTGDFANYTIEIDHYLEFWNMTNKDIAVSDLGPNPFLRIANQFGWLATGSTPGTDIPESPSRDFSVPLSAFRDSNGNPLVFRAGVPSVLTTDPTPLPSAFGVDSSRLFRPPAGTPADQYRIYSGITTYKAGGSYLRITAQTRPTLNGYDYETELILGNDNGVIESFGAPAVDVISVNVDDGTPPYGQDSAKLWSSANNDTCAYHFRGSSLKGNASAFSPIPSQKGDPRTNDEQLSLSSSSSVGDDQTAYKNELNSTNLPNYVTLTALNSQFVDCTKWTDPSNNIASQANAPGVVANAPLISVGELGNVFDPARAIGNGSGDIAYSRGGGRTLKIGQPDRYDVSTNPDGLWDGDSNSASREWTAWRLTDIFTTTDSASLDGRININGVNRDGGAAFNAALYGYNFEVSPDSDPAIASQALTDTEVDALVSQMQTRLNNQSPFTQTIGPFAERGELSEMPVFNSGSTLTGHDMSSIDDRGREELFRRLAELITTRGNVFTVYAVGQALVPQTGSTSPVTTSTAQLKVTFRIDPVWNVPPIDPFDPHNPSVRFQKPDSYAVKILYAGD